MTGTHRLPSTSRRVISHRHEAGLTLLEMMIALAIGSWVVIAATALYLSISRAALFQQDINVDQQGVQFVQQFLSGRLQQASGISPESTTQELVLVQKGALSSNGKVIDCAGQVHDETTDWLEPITFDASQRLTCRGAVLLENVANISLHYGLDRDHNHYLQEKEYLIADDISETEWPLVTAIRVEFSFLDHHREKMQHAHLLYFTLHKRMLTRSDPS